MNHIPEGRAGELPAEELRRGGALLPHRSRAQLQKVEGADELLDALFFHSIPYDKYLPAPLAGPARGAVGNLMAAFSRRWMGQERADMLDIPDNAAAALAIPALRAAVTARERLRKAGLSPSDERLVDIEFALSGALRRVLRPSLPMRPDAVS